MSVAPQQVCHPWLPAEAESVSQKLQACWELTHCPQMCRLLLMRQSSLLTPCPLHVKETKDHQSANAIHDTAQKQHVQCKFPKDRATSGAEHGSMTLARSGHSVLPGTASNTFLMDISTWTKNVPWTMPATPELQLAAFTEPITIKACHGGVP